MKSKNIKYVLLVILIASLSIGYSQQKFILKGDQQVENLQYHSAVENYLKAFDKMKEDSPELDKLLLKIANTYQKMNNSYESVRWYKDIADKEFSKEHPEVYLYYAQTLNNIGDLEKSKVYYQKYLDVYPDNELAVNALMALDKFDDSTIKSPYIVEKLQNINSENDDFAAVYSSKNYNEIIFTSNRKGSTGKDKDEWTDGWFSDFYFSSLKDGNWTEPQMADDNVILNTEANEGAGVFDGRFSSFYYTRCERGVNDKVYCEVLQTERSGQRWSRPKTVLSDSAFNVGQPWISNDELVIYFASNRDGGYGGKDIWMASRIRKSNEFDNFENLGSVINTAGDEMFPYLAEDSLLYFSSNGHPSYGGLDIFVSSLKKSNSNEVKNLLAPINSSGDDFAIVFKNEKEGMFSSNRSGGIGGDDIYSFERKKLNFSLKGLITDANTLQTIDSVKVSLLNNNNTIIEVFSDEIGEFHIDSSFFYENKKYDLLFSRDNYFAGRDSLNTYGFNSDNEFSLRVEMEEIPTAPIVLPDILYDYDKWELKPQYRDSLNVLVRTLEDNPGLIIELRSHTDSRSTLEYNDELSQKRAQTVVDFLIKKGIDKDRMVAQGYGERVPRILTKDLTLNGIVIRKGTELNDDFIESAYSEDIKEKLFELNRRTGFKVLAKDFAPKNLVLEENSKIIEFEKALPYKIYESKISLNCYLNDYELDVIVDTGVNYSLINAYKVRELFEKNFLSIDDIQGDKKGVNEKTILKNGIRLKIKSIRIGDKIYENQVVIVSNDIKSSLMLGNNIVKIQDFEINAEDENIIFK